MSVFRVFLVRIFPHVEYKEVYFLIQSKCGKVRTSKTFNADTFYAVQQCKLILDIKLYKVNGLHVTKTINALLRYYITINNYNLN